jgi:hypothetical protein
MTAVRRTQLVRLGVWVGVATVAVVAAVLAARTESGVRRIASLISPEAHEPVRGAKGPTPSLAIRQADQEAEQRRLSEAIRLLAADRDRLLARVNTLERNVEDVTGSIGNAPAARVAPQSALPVIAASPPPATSEPPKATAPRAAAAPVPAPQPAPARVSAGHLATGVGTPASESVATKTEFGIDLGGNGSIEGLKTLWSNLKSHQPTMLEGLRPVIAIRDGQRPGSVELRLIAGPIANANVAARLCAAFAAAGQVCQPAVFDGQKLALQ